MRLVLGFIFGGLFYGFITEWGRCFYREDYEFSYFTAIFNGIIFAITIAIVIYLIEKRKQR